VTSAIWLGAPQRLDRVLAELRLVRSRSQAAEVIARAHAYVDGAPVLKSGAKVRPGAEVSVLASDHYVSRAAHKLIAALDEFCIDPSGLLALDIGASTGGFTQVLLERGAGRVIALDVGHAQLAEQIREDPRVRVVEGCNARSLTAEVLADRSGVDEPPSLVVADVSFISLELILPAISAVAAPDAQVVLLIKPQFEVGRQGIVDGIVRDDDLAMQAALRVLESAGREGLNCQAVRPSPLRGEHGNRELLAHFTRDAPTNPTEWNLAIRELFGAGGEW